MVVADGDAIEFLVVNVDQFPSHVQAFQGNLDLEEGQSYTFSCQLKASSNREILLTAKID